MEIIIIMIGVATFDMRGCNCEDDPKASNIFDKK